MRGGVVVTAAHDPEHDAGVSQCGRLNPAQQQQYKRSRVVVRQPSKHAKPQERPLGDRASSFLRRSEPHACSTAPPLSSVPDKTILLVLCA